MGRPHQYENSTERQLAHRQKKRREFLSHVLTVQGAGYTLYQGDACAIAPMLQGIDAHPFQHVL
jgi:hypothetical protein